MNYRHRRWCYLFWEIFMQNGPPSLNRINYHTHNGKRETHPIHPPLRCLSALIIALQIIPYWQDCKKRMCIAWTLYPVFFCLASSPQSPYYVRYLLQNQNMNRRWCSFNPHALPSDLHIIHSSLLFGACFLPAKNRSISFNYESSPLFVPPLPLVLIVRRSPRSSQRGSYVFSFISNPHPLTWGYGISHRKLSMS